MTLLLVLQPLLLLSYCCCYLVVTSALLSVLLYDSYPIVVTIVLWLPPFCYCYPCVIVTSYYYSVCYWYPCCCYCYPSFTVAGYNYSVCYLVIDIAAILASGVGVNLSLFISIPLKLTRVLHTLLLHKQIAREIIKFFSF